MWTDDLSFVVAAVPCTRHPHVSVSARTLPRGRSFRSRLGDHSEALFFLGLMYNGDDQAFWSSYLTGLSAQAPYTPDHPALSLALSSSVSPVPFPSSSSSASSSSSSSSHASSYSSSSNNTAWPQYSPLPPLKFEELVEDPIDWLLSPTISSSWPNMSPEPFAHSKAGSDYSFPARADHRVKQEDTSPARPVLVLPTHYAEPQPSEPSEHHAHTTPDPVTQRPSLQLDNQRMTVKQEAVVTQDIPAGRQEIVVPPLERSPVRGRTFVCPYAGCRAPIFKKKSSFEKVRGGRAPNFFEPRCLFREGSARLTGTRVSSSISACTLVKSVS